MNQRVLFVCMGNICRSPAAEAVLRAFAQRAGVDVEVDSAGTIDYHAGNPADARVCRAASRRGYELTSRARKVTPSDLAEFDLTVAMDRENLRDLQRWNVEGRGELKLLSEFLDDTWPRDVPDPYYGGPEGFERVLDMIEAACPAILAQLAAKAEGN